MKLDVRLTLFLYLVGVFLTCLLVGDLIGGKLTEVTIPGIDHTLIFSVGQISFPLTFVLTDILNEFYGRRVVRRVTLLGLAMTGLAFAMLHIAAALPWMDGAHEPGWTGLPPDAWESVFTGATQIQIASMAAFLLGQLLDISIFFAIKRATGNRFLWLRATGSTALSQLIDTVVVTLLGFTALSMDVKWEMIRTAYLVKLTIAIALTPVIYALHALIERAWGLEPAPLEVASGDVGGRDEPGRA
jgi:uncharacterized integral membrane protein (TIGR00697 family)